MKKLFCVILLSFLFFNASAIVKLKGNMKNAANAKVIISSYGSIINYQVIDLYQTFTDSTGNFSAEFNIQNPQVIKIKINEQYTDLFLKDGYDLNLTADYKDFDNTLKYIGVGEYDNNYFATDFKQFFYDKAYGFSSINQVDLFKSKVDSTEIESNKLFSTFDKSKFSNEFLRYIIPTLKYRFIDVRWSYSIYMDANTHKFVNRELPSGYMDFINDINIDDQLAAGNSRYKVALMRYFYENLDKNLFSSLSDTIPLDTRVKITIREGYNGRKKVLKKEVLDSELSTFLKYNFRQINESNQYFFDSIFNDYLSTTKNAEYHNELISHFTKINSVNKKYLPKSLSLLDAKGNSVRFSDLEGKVLYIDFWATWCAPCIANMNDSEKLMKELNNSKELVFVYINVKDSKKRWLSYLEKNKLEGLHLYADEETSEKLYKEFYINGIPRYMIVSKDGKLMESVAMPPLYVKESLKKAAGL